MYILIDTLARPYNIDNEAALKRKLRKLCAAWADDDRYSGPDAKTLFQQCWDEHDFGDIAQVFKYDNPKAELCAAEVGESVVLTRIM